MTRFKVGDWAVRNRKNCIMTWEGLDNTPVQVTLSKLYPVQEIMVDLFPGKWWAGELFNSVPAPSMKLEEWL